jgi:hypothetical protein
MLFDICAAKVLSYIHGHESDDFVHNDDEVILSVKFA